MNFSVVKITLNDNSIFDTNTPLMSFMANNRWDVPKVFNCKKDAIAYTNNYFVKNIMKILGDNYIITEAHNLTEEFMHINDVRKGANIIDIRISNEETFTTPQYFVVFTDVGETCDMHSRIFSDKKFWSYDEAKSEIISDMKEMKKQHGYEYIDESKLEIWSDEKSIGSCGCIYTILKF